MLVLITVENGVKKIIPLTADAGAGNPVGSLLHTYKKSNPSGYLYCDGSTFDQTKYPLLYAYLGTNVLPDYREAVEVGAEQNTTDTIATHDVYTEGQFKDDQLQEHSHTYRVGGSFGSTAGIAVLSITSQGEDSIDQTGRHGDTTHGKQKAVFVYIKATSGLSENAQDNVINTLNEQRSYSTEEVNTGKKWIDGKSIYRKVLTTTSAINTDSFYWGGLETEIQNMNVSSVIDVRGIDSISSRPMAFSSSAGFSTFSTGLAQGGKIILEYTKTN